MAWSPGVQCRNQFLGSRWDGDLPGPHDLPCRNLLGYGVDVDGSGSVSMSGSDELNYRGLAEITTKESFFTNTVARLSGAALKDGKLQFPFRIGGTIDSPVFSRGKGDKDVDATQNHR